MKYKKVFYGVLIILFLVFLTILTASETGYYEYSNNQKTMFTEEKIKEFEKDIVEGKDVNIKDYITDTSKDYSNKITDIGDGLSNFIYDAVNAVLKKGFGIIENMIN